MSLTTEERRALDYNLSLKKRRQAANVRSIQLQGNAGAAKGLIDRTQAILTEENDEQKAKIRFNKYDDFSNIENNSGSISGDAKESSAQASRSRSLREKAGLSGDRG